MSDSEYDIESVETQKVNKTTKKAPSSSTKKRKSSSNKDIRSDSEFDNESVEANNKTTKKAPSSTAKKRKSQSSKDIRNKKSETFDIFGLGDVDHEVEETKPTRLTSYILNRVANGTQKRVATTDGDFYVELKVYHRDDAESSAPDERWKKALLRVSCYLESDSSQWKNLQQFVKDVNFLYKDSAPTFFSDKLNIKRA